MTSGVLVGFAALAIDVGHMYAAEAELQRTADAAAHAAVQELAAFRGAETLDRARAVAQAYAGRNKVLGESLTLESADVGFGRAYISQTTGRYVFEEGDEFPNAVRIRARRTADSPSGPVPLFFAGIFGVSQKNMSAEATAALTPRDITFVLDLSGSHADDSCLQSYKNTNISNRGVWEMLWDRTLAAQATQDGWLVGPSFGNMKVWGANVTGPGWSFADDPGLIRLQKHSTWQLSSEWLSQTLLAKGYGTYTEQEVAGINQSNLDTDHAYYRRRVLVALGIYRWNSGLSGGQPGGNGDDIIDASEVQTMVPYPSSATNPSTFCKKVGGSWDAYVDYAANPNAIMCLYNPAQQLYGDAGLVYRFGLKTWLDYVLEYQGGSSNSPGLNGTPEEPMGAVANGVREALDIIEALDSNDLVGVASYGTYGYGPAQKPSHMSWLTQDLDSIRTKVGQLQAGMWSSTTNMAQGIDRGVDVLLNSAESRTNATKCMLLLTDGKPNQTRANPTQYYSEFTPNSPPKLDAKTAAQDARNQGIRIYTISVGSNADTTLMQQIATIGGGAHFHAEGSIATYRSQLGEIFRELGGRRPVVFIQ